MSLYHGPWIVYSTGDTEVSVPPSMGSPLPDQLTGTPLENLGELASRICYDSLGVDADGKRRGRSSEALHEHIIEVKNLSVYEHCNITLSFDTVDPKFLCHFLNRKGIHVDYGKEENIEVTANIRSILEWEQYSCASNSLLFDNYYPQLSFMDARTGVTDPPSRPPGELMAPRIFGKMREKIADKRFELFNSTDTTGKLTLIGRKIKIENLTDDQVWISFYLHGSRGFTHEQVRHRYAMSQRSTRYVDESESPYVVHPLTRELLTKELYNGTTQSPGSLNKLIQKSIFADKETYKAIYGEIYDHLHLNGADRSTARKQARGAARGYLGNALASEMIFSAPVSGWKSMLRSRLSPLADAEIREVYAGVLSALKASRHSDRFESYSVAPSPDGIGGVLRIS